MKITKGKGALKKDKSEVLKPVEDRLEQNKNNLNV